eukprot:CAMPEP_0115541538 /NCGR_PEP_ID=MMETSP0271-20121206/90520_1 /TAXON_ID=71861 /ORGANISM="Scrippsiella trochoidea, Strain CCMP3099" /LENGTH=146 /DNA_ID=CAMNT_0002974617 /DNA_START=53 /DNA_END=490 /DNA_ORIENTATION=-
MASLGRVAPQQPQPQQPLSHQVQRQRSCPALLSVPSSGKVAQVAVSVQAQAAWQTGRGTPAGYAPATATGAASVPVALQTGTGPMHMTSSAGVGPQVMLSPGVQGTARSSQVPPSPPARPGCGQLAAAALAFPEGVAIGAGAGVGA